MIIFSWHRLQKCLTDEAMETDEGPLINENSNGLSHLLTEGEFNSVDAGGVADESSTSNHAFLSAVELSTGSVGDYLEENDTSGFNANSFDEGDNAVTYPGDSLADGDSRGDRPASEADGDEKPKMDTDFDISESEASCQLPDENTVDNRLNDITDHINASNENSESAIEEKRVCSKIKTYRFTYIFCLDEAPRSVLT